MQFFKPSDSKFLLSYNLLSPQELIFKLPENLVAPPPIIDDLCEVYNYIINSELMHKSMSEAVTILLHKSGDPSSPDNKRPISLLNVDYKVVAKMTDKWGYIAGHYK